MKKLDHSFTLILIFLSAIIFYSCTAKAQSIQRQVISGLGASYNLANIQVDQTVGEVITSTESNSNIIITQGFHQPEESISIDISEVERIVQLKVYPNPTSNKVFIDITKVEAQSLSFQLIDLSGKMLLQKDNIYPISNLETLDMSLYAAGTYSLCISDEQGKPLQHFKIAVLR